MTFQLDVVLVSTRPGRAGPAIASWFLTQVERHAKFAVHLIDLALVALPLLDEPHHPRLRQYEHEHTKAWSRTIDAADAFVFVTPEYNYGTPPSLVNALDYLHHEWAYKPVAFVSYGGVSGGTRSAQMTKEIVTTLRMMPIPEAVALPFFAQQLDREKNQFTPPKSQEDAAVLMLDELHRWATALKAMRPGR
jgi:NAD(P)H-dependent FMN reductase